MTQFYDYNPKLKIPDALYTPLSGVKLTGGLFRTVFENNRRFLDKLDDGKMSYWFDVKAGRPTDAEPYKGHFEDNLKGSTLSMFLMGASNMLRWVDDPALSERAERLAAVIRDTAEDDGFLMPVDKRNFAWREYPHYVRIWLTYALAAYGLSGKGDGYAMLRKWQDWFNACPDLPIIKYLELAFQGVVASTYVYTTPAGRFEDIEKTIEFYEEPWRLAQFMRREADCVHVRKQPGREPHAHGTELESFEGYLDLYRATGRNYYLEAVKGAWELYRRDWQHPGGGIVMCEGMSTNHPKCYWLDPKNNYNELCCTSFWIFLNQRLHRLFPDEEAYAAEIEKSLYNIAIANQDNGDGIRYFAYLEGKKQPSGLVHCCCGVGTHIFGSLPEFIFSAMDNTVSVDLYAPAEFDWQGPGVKLTLDADAAFRDDASLTVNTPEPKELTVRLRIPSWSGDTEVFLNGGSLGRFPSGSYAPVTRVFRDGDTLTCRFSRSFRLTEYVGDEQLDGGNVRRYYIERGPLLYAVAGPSFRQARYIGWTADDFESWLTPSGSGYSIAQHPEYSLIPYAFLDGSPEFTCCPVMKY